MKSLVIRACGLFGTIAAVGLVLLGAACGKEAAEAPAPAPKVAEVSAAASPAATPLPAEEPPRGPGIGFPVEHSAPAAAAIKGAPFDDPDLFLYAKVHSPARTFDRVTSWITQLNTETDSTAVHDRIASTGFDPAQFRGGADITFYMWKPSQEGDNSNWALELPLLANAPMQLMLSFIAPAHTTYGSDVVVANTQETADAIDVLPDDLQAVGRVRMQSDFEIGINVQAMYAYYGPRLREQIQSMQEMIAGGDPAPGEEAFVGRTRAAQRQMRAQTEAMFALADQVQSICFSLTLDPDAAKMNLFIDPIPGTPLAEVFDKRPTDMANVSRYLGSGHTFAMQIDLGRNKDLIADYVRYRASLLPEDKAALAQEMQDAVAKLLDAGIGSYAVAVDIATSSTMLGGSVIQAEKPEDLVAFIRQNAQLLGIQTFGASSGIDFQVSAHPDVRKIEDFSVDHYDLDFTVPATIPEQQAQMIKSLWGGGKAQVEMMPYGSAALVSMGMPMENLMPKVNGGKEASMLADSALRSRNIFPKGAFLYADVDVPAYMKAITAPMGFRQPTNNVQSAPLAFAGYHQNGIGYYRVELPIETFAALEGMAPPPPPPGMRGDRRGGPGAGGRGQGQGMRGGRTGRRGMGLFGPRPTPQPEPDAQAQPTSGGGN